MDEQKSIFEATVDDIYGPKYAQKPSLLDKSGQLQRDVVAAFLGTLNISNPLDVQRAISMVCRHLNSTSPIPPIACEQLLQGQFHTQSFRVGGDMAFTDVKVSHTSVIILALLYTLELTLSLLGNTMVLLIFTCCRQMRSVTNFFIVSLAASDLLMTVSSIPLHIAQVLTGFWQFGAVVCKLGPFTTQLSVAASSLTLCCIAMDRYIAVVHPLRLSTIQKPRRAALLMTGVWIVAITTAYPFLHYHHLLKLCLGAAGDCALYCGMPASLLWLHWVTYLLLLLVPFLLMGVSYTIIIFKLWGRQPVGTTVVSVESLRMQYKKKAIKMLFLVMLIFTSCWMPLLTFDLLAKLFHWTLSHRLVTARYYLQFLALSATCLNPIVYAIMHDKFRNNFRRLCCACTIRQVTPLVQQPAVAVSLPPTPRPATSLHSVDHSSSSSSSSPSSHQGAHKGHQKGGLQNVRLEKFHPDNF